MKKRRFLSAGARFFFIWLMLGGLTSPCAQAQTAESGPAGVVFNIKDFGATGTKADNSRPAIQRAVDACAEAGGGMVYLPPGEFTSGTIHLRSHVRFFIEAGATLFASRDKQDYDKLALFYGEDLTNVSIEGRGLVDGQSEYEWRLNDIDDRFIRDNQLLMETAGKPLLRSFPKDYALPKMVLLLRCRDVRISGLSFVRSPSWTIHPYGCERMVIDGVYIYSSLKEAVWADGIDPDGCKDLRIANSTIETGDDAIVFYSMDWFGPALPCENITIINCRLSSASSALKFCDGNKNCVRKVTVSNCVITDSNRGLAFMVFDGGYVSDVVISDLTIDCVRHDWFWWGDGDPFHFNIKRRSEVHPQVEWENEPPAGSIRNVKLQNIIARGKGSSLINGHPMSWLDGITLENVKLFLSHDPEAPIQKVEHALKFRWARNLKIRGFEVVWDRPESDNWKSALYFEDIKGLEVAEFAGRQGLVGAEQPAIVLNQVEDAHFWRNRALPDTGIFFDIRGERSRALYLFDNDLLEARLPLRIAPEVGREEVKTRGNLEKAGQ
ncbi:MAG: glycosyl hydrolase family 28 protein [Candidatus Aminicenantales bacterium]